MTRCGELAKTNQKQTKSRIFREKSQETELIRTQTRFFFGLQTTKNCKKNLIRENNKRPLKLELKKTLKNKRRTNTVCKNESIKEDTLTLVTD